MTLESVELVAARPYPASEPTAPAARFRPGRTPVRLRQGHETKRARLGPRHGHAVTGPAVRLSWLGLTYSSARQGSGEARGAPARPKARPCVSCRTITEQSADPDRYRAAVLRARR